MSFSGCPDSADRTLEAARIVDLVQDVLAHGTRSLCDLWRDVPERQEPVVVGRNIAIAVDYEKAVRSRLKRCREGGTRIA